MLIPCPHCGNRDVSEFTYVGDAKAKRPSSATTDTSRAQDTWDEFIYYRDNPLGPHKELWQHVGGCRQFVELVRNTRTHEITGSKGRGPHLEGNHS
ncbi:MAG: sarcosine oxidase subunit delta [Hyphomicrobiales bacterium]